MLPRSPKPEMCLLTKKLRPSRRALGQKLTLQRPIEMVRFVPIAGFLRKSTRRTLGSRPECPRLVTVAEDAAEDTSSTK